jgi:hypothetical protein
MDKSKVNLCLKFLINDNILIAMVVLCTTFTLDAQSFTTHKLEVNFQGFKQNDTYEFANISGSGSSAMPHSNINVFSGALGINYGYSLNHRWSLVGGISFTSFSPINISIQFDTPHEIPFGDNTIPISLIRLGSTNKPTIFFDICPSWSIINHKILRLDANAGLGIMGNSLMDQDAIVNGFLTFFTPSPPPVFGSYNIRQRSYWKGYGALEISGDLKIGSEGFFISWGCWYRFFLRSITSISTFEVTDGGGNNSSFEFTSGLSLLGIRIGTGYTF